MIAKFGWVNRPREVDAVLARMPFPVFGAIAPALDTTPKSTMLWEAERKVLGGLLDAWFQEIGDCVSMGWGRGWQDLLFAAAARGDIVFPGLVATEVIYGLSRVEIGGGRISGDGSVGAWMADAGERYGVLVRKRYSGKWDFTKYSGQMAKQLGRYGCPDELEPEAKSHSAGHASLVKTFDELRIAIQNGSPVPICSMQGFKETRQQGTAICDPYGEWAHCMLCRGFLILKGNRWAGTIQQSWGNDNPGGPRKCILETGEEIEIPLGCFNVDAEVIEKRMLRMNDSFAQSPPGGWRKSDGGVFLTT